MLQVECSCNLSVNLEGMDEVSVTPLAVTRWRSRAAVCLITAAVAVSPLAGLSQGSFDSLKVLTADGSAPLHTHSVSLSLPEGVAAPLEFKFGFETDEVFGPGQFFDSFTLTLRTIDDLFSLILVTADASGVLFAPPTPGSLTLADTAVVRSAIPSPSLTPHLAQQYAFSVTTVLPDSLIGRDATLFLDLFDNNNGVISHGWLADITLVPEPTLWPLIPLAGMVLFRKRFRKH